MERPLLVSTDLIKPVQEGRKTETRRLSGLDVVNEEPDKWELIDLVEQDGRYMAIFDYLPRCIVQHDAFCPYGKPGDVLWVRESWFTSTTFDYIKPSLLPIHAPAGYVADPGRPRWAGKTRPSIHMPKQFCRIRLELLDVSVERLHSIKRNGVLNEGAGREVRQMWLFGLSAEERDEVYRRSFRRLWVSINGDASWQLDPWVWVLHFKKVDG